MNLLIRLTVLAILFWPVHIKLEYVKRYYVVGVGLVFIVIGALISKHKILQSKEIFAALIIFTASSIFQFFDVGYTLSKDYIYSCYFLAVFFGIYVMAKYIIHVPELRHKIQNTLYTSSIPISLVAIWESIAQKNIWSVLAPVLPSFEVVVPVSNVVRSTSFIGNPIPLSVFCSSVALMALIQLRRRRNYLLIISLWLNLSACVATLSRSGLLGLCVALGFYVLIHYFMTRDVNFGQKALGAVFLAITLSITIWFSSEYVAQNLLPRLSGYGTDEGVNYRLVQWETLVGNMISRPVLLLFGGGPGAVTAYYGRGLEISERGALEEAPTVDNAYVSVLYQFGIPGIAFILWIIWHTLKKREKLGISDGDWSGLVMLNIAVSSFFYEVQPWFTSVLIASLCVAQSTTAIKSVPRNSNNKLRFIRNSKNELRRF